MDESQGLLQVLALIGLFAASFVASLLLTPQVKKFAARRGYVDRPGGRKIHEGEIPRLGGVAIYLAFAVTTLLFFLFSGRIVKIPVDTAPILLGSVVILALGIYDDTRGARVWLKFLVQTAVAVYLVATGLLMEVVTNPFGGQITLGVLAYPVTILWIVGIINAINLSDGMDGLASGISLIALVTMTAVTFITGQRAVQFTTVALAGAITGFLPYNFYPAKIFMGDTGSLFLGYMLAVVSIRASAVSSTTVSLLIPLVALGLPIFDTLFALYRRFLLKRRVFSADRDHVHHKILAMGFSHKQTVLILYWICLIFGFMAFMMTAARNKEIAGFIILFAVVIYVMVGNLGYIGHIVSHRHELAKRNRQERYESGYRISNQIIDKVKHLLGKPLITAIQDLIIVVLSFYGAILLAHRPQSGFLSLFYVHRLQFAVAIFFLFGSFLVGDCYRDVRRYVGFQEIGKYIKAIFGSVIFTYFFSDYLLRTGSLQLNVYLAYFLILMAGILASRIVANFYYNYTKREVASSRPGERILIYGAGDTGEALLYMLTKVDYLNFRPVGFVDDDPDKQNRIVAGYKIMGDVYSLPAILKETEASRVVIATPHLNERREAALRFYCKRHSVKVGRFQLRLDGT